MVDLGSQTVAEIMPVATAGLPITIDAELFMAVATAVLPEVVSLHN